MKTDKFMARIVAAIGAGVIALLIALALVAAGARIAGAHGHGTEWLVKNGCCGPKDCFRLRVQYTPKGYRVLDMQRAVDGRIFPAPPWLTILDPTKMQPSRDGHFWACFFLDPAGNPKSFTYHETKAGTRRCLFRPEAGG